MFVCVSVCVCIITIPLQAWISQTISLTIRFYLPSFFAGPLDYTLYPYRTDVDRFLLVVQHLHVRVKRSLRERHL